MPEINLTGDYDYEGWDWPHAMENITSFGASFMSMLNIWFDRTLFMLGYLTFSIKLIVTFYYST